MTVCVYVQVCIVDKDNNVIGKADRAVMVRRRDGFYEQAGRITSMYVVY